MSRYFYFILFIFFGSAAGLWPLLLESKLPTSCTDIIVDTHGECQLNPSFTTDFDHATCAITVFNVWDDHKCTDEVYINLDNGSNWILITPKQPVILSNIKDCDNIRISKDPDGNNPIAYGGMLACNCGPCTPVDGVAKAAIQQVLADPMNNYLDNSCCCADYDFIFPDGTKVQAIAATLHLRVDALNNKFHNIESMDEVGKTISLD